MKEYDYAKQDWLEQRIQTLQGETEMQKGKDIIDEPHSVSENLYGSNEGSERSNLSDDKESSALDPIAKNLEAEGMFGDLQSSNNAEDESG